MIDGLYAAANGMYAQQGMIDNVANNLANISTPAYKGGRRSFQDLLYQQQGPNRAVAGGSVGAGAAGVSLGLSMTQGAISATGNPLDLAIEGPGFFQVGLADGSTGLYRGGAFRLDATRRLVTPEGNLLVPSITIPANVPTDQIAVSATGVVSYGTQNLGKITLANVPAPENLEALGGSLYRANANSGAITTAPGGVGFIQAGAQEGSNVDVAAETSLLIQAQRTYDLCSRAVRTWDEMLQTANGIRR